MSFRGGRSTQRTILPFGLEYADIISTTQEAEKPQLLLPINGDLTELEKVIAKQSISYTKIMADGPFFTGNLDSLKKSDQKNKNTKATTTSTTSADGIERYSDRYKKVQKIGRTIEEHPYQPQFFPEELYSVMGITNKEKKKILALSKFKSNGGLKEFLSTKEIEDMNEAEKAKAMAQELLNIADDHDDHKGENNSGDEEEEMDDAYEDDEEDDYNAEQYFDDGDDDGGDDGGDDEAAF